MATAGRANVKKLTKTAGMIPKIVQPWVSSGVFDADSVVCNAGCLLGGIMVHATDGDGDILVQVWDSPDSTLTSDVEVARVAIGLTDKYWRDVMFPEPGIECENGIYVDITGDCVVCVYYR